MERLTVKRDKPSINSQYAKKEKVWTADCIEKLGKYEDAEEQGLLFRLPVTIGTPVYVVESECEGDPYDCYHCCESCGSYNRFVAEVKFDIEWIDVVGKMVFLAKEEAEQALKQMGE